MKLRSLLFSAAVSLTMVVHAAAPSAAPGTPSKEEAQIRQTLTQMIPGLEVRSIRPSSMSGVYEVESNHQETLFVSADGQFFVVGELYQVKPEGIVNLTEVRKGEARQVALTSLPEKDLVVFKPKQTKAKITIFTDVDCGYCRKLHQEVPRMNELGIQVSYAAFPRSGPGTPSFKTMEAVWCAKNQQEAMTQAKNGKQIPAAAKDCKNPVAAQFDLGNRIGVTGTPAIFLEDGTLIPGYVPADTLAKGLGLIK